MKKKLKVLFLLTILLFSLVAVSKAEEPMVSALYFDTDIREALNDLMLQTGINIIADETVTGLVTVDIEETTLENALKLILLSGGYSYRRFDDVYLISLADPRSPAFQQMAESKTFSLDYISASEARELLPYFYDKYLRSSDERDIITITSTPEIISRFKKDLARIDTPPKKIRIQAVVTEVSSDLIKEYGSDFFDLLTEEVEDQNNLILQENKFELNWYGRDSRILTNLKVLEKEQKAEIKADPEIIVSDRERGSLFVGEEQVMVLEPENSSSRLERIEVGVSLEVFPKITSENDIRLTLTPQISHFTEEADKRLRIRRSEVSSTVNIGNRETLVLAGMTVESTEENERKVPVLGDIPFVRWFFRQDEDKKIDRELLILITPEIIN
ncbi:MAG: type II secretion system protein GspD [Bacillota bacterium]